MISYSLMTEIVIWGVLSAMIITSLSAVYLTCKQLFEEKENKND